MVREQRQFYRATQDIHDTCDGLLFVNEGERVKFSYRLGNTGLNVIRVDGEQLWVQQRWLTEETKQQRLEALLEGTW